MATAVGDTGLEVAPRVIDVPVPAQGVLLLSPPCDLGRELTWDVTQLWKAQGWRWMWGFTARCLSLELVELVWHPHTKEGSPCPLIPHWLCTPASLVLALNNLMK